MTTVSAALPDFPVSPTRPAQASLGGWARFPVQKCDVYRPERQSDIPRLYNFSPSLISRGMGRSFGDAALNQDGAVMVHNRLNRFLGFNEDRGLLRCEGGTSIAEILETVVPKGFCLAASPGTRFVTIGGAIACDVHGKNHATAGSFGDTLVQIELATPAGVRVCSPSENAEVFWATVGGMGMTGAILSATIRLRRIETAYLNCEYKQLPDLESTLSEFLAHGAAEHEYAIAWIDLLARGRNFGRSILMRASHASRAELPSSAMKPFELSMKPSLTLPGNLPFPVLTPFTAKLFNSFYYFRHSTQLRLIPMKEFLYAMDAIANWNSTYGSPGYVEHQCAIPTEGAHEAITKLLEICSRSGHKVFLASIKKFGKANRGLLSFPIPGFTLVLDLPVCAGIEQLVRELDEVVVRYGGRIYLAKDALLDRERFRAMYPNWKRLQDLKAVLDPHSVLQSSLARRVGLVTA